jgi:hypothetical protein
LQAYWSQQTGREWPDPQRKYVEQLYQCIHRVTAALIADGPRPPSVLRRILRYLRGTASEDCAAVYRRRFMHATDDVVRQLMSFLRRTHADRAQDAAATVESVARSVFSTAFALYEMADEVVGTGWMAEQGTLEFVNDLKNQAEWDRRAMFDDLERRPRPDAVVPAALGLLLEACDVAAYDASDWVYRGDGEPHRLQHFDSHAARRASEDLGDRLKNLDRPHVDAVRFLRFLRSAAEEVQDWLRVDRREIRDFVAKSPVTTIYDLQSRPGGGTPRPDGRVRPAARPLQQTVWDQRSRTSAGRQLLNAVSPLTSNTEVLRHVKAWLGKHRYGIRRYVAVRGPFAPPWVCKGKGSRGPAASGGTPGASRRSTPATTGTEPRWTFTAACTR